jgi:precorrin-6Y C5,15-methyltransferase (decarboxylating)
MSQLIHVIGIGLDGTAGLTESVRHHVEQATLLVGSDRHLSYFPNYPGEQIVLGNFTSAIEKIRQHPNSVAVLTSGDPLFFGFGRLLLEELPHDRLVFHPNLSSVQLAFNRIKCPWHDARIISAHGRSLDELTQALQQGVEKIAVLTDPTRNPSAIAELLLSLDLPSRYQIWVCENLGGCEEHIIETRDPKSLLNQSFAALNIVILQRLPNDETLDLQTLPLIGLPDHRFLSFSDRPGLMTKREVRTLVLAELALQANQIVWDVGAGTGSVAIEIARLCPMTKIYAIEKTAAGISLIQKNSQRFHVQTIHPVQGEAPEALTDLPTPDRIFIGGSGGNLDRILDCCLSQLADNGVIVLALATLEHLTQIFTYLSRFNWPYRLLQVQIARSTAVASLTRFTPLNPVTLITITKSLKNTSEKA